MTGQDTDRLYYIAARLKALKAAMVNVRIWPVKELREFLMLVREREEIEHQRIRREP